jgi:hypothetical protein
LHFYVDESGHTGPNIFDRDQPMLYYGVLSSKFDVDVLAEPHLQKMRAELGVDRLHANQLGNGGLVQILPHLLKLQHTLGFAFDVYRVSKPDHAIISFFDQVFDSGMNPAMTWTGYWTPLRYILLQKLAYLFDERLAKAAWEARISLDTNAASVQLQTVCKALFERIHRLPDARSREVIGDSLKWAINNPDELYYNTKTAADRLQVMPNIIGFQAVMHGITARVKTSNIKAERIVVDQQSQFNKAQKTLAEFYAAVREIELEVGPGLPKMDLKHMPDVPLIFMSSTKSGGLELVDIHLWVVKRILENKPVAKELLALMAPHMHLGRIDEISLRALVERWTPYFEQLPELHEMSAEQLAFGADIKAKDEERRRAAVAADSKGNS